MSFADDEYVEQGHGDVNGNLGQLIEEEDYREEVEIQDDAGNGDYADEGDSNAGTSVDELRTSESNSAPHPIQGVSDQSEHAFITI